MTPKQKAKALFEEEMAALPAGYRATLVEWDDLPPDALAAWIEKASAPSIEPSEADVRAYYEAKQANILPRYRQSVGLVAWNDLSQADRDVWTAKFQRGE